MAVAETTTRRSTLLPGGDTAAEQVNPDHGTGAIT
jgi:hypothetical protein